MIQSIAIYAAVFLFGMIVGYWDANRIWKKTLARTFAAKS